MTRRFSAFCLLAISAAPAALGLPAARSPAGEAKRPEATRRVVQFERDVRPILSRRCIRCHNAAEKNGGLGLGDRDSALAELDSGARAILPDQPEASELLRRVASTDAAERMPPVGKPLAPGEIDTLRAWIAQGAPWPPHWAYRPLERPAIPAAIPEAGARSLSTWARSPVDRFVLSQLAEHALQPSGEAARRTWLRRVTFDLTGLPPAPEELDEFLADESPEAFERAVDRLLASPHYGERWARHWMDVVHYAETHGHDQDRPRPNAWPYRDYLIRSLNADKPYGRFIEEQVAGDALFPDDAQAIVATGFLATGPWDESSLRDIREDTLDREIARYLDRDDIVTTVMATLTSTTIHCARCHDHKFDPITQAEYYGLQAVFAATDKANRRYDADPQTARRRRELLAQKAGMPERLERLDASLLEPGVQADVAEWEREIAAAASQWVVLEPESFSSENGATLTIQPDRSLLSGGERPPTDVYTVTAHTDVGGITGIRLEVLTDDSLPHRGPGRQDNGNLHLNEFQVTATPRNGAGDSRPVALVNPTADFDQDGWTIAMAVDGNPASAWGIFPEVGRPHRAVFELREPLAFDGGATLSFRLEQTHGGGHLIGRVRLSVTTAAAPLPLDADVLPPDIAEIVRAPSDARTDRQRARLAAYVVEQKLDRELAALPPPQLVYAGTSEFDPDGRFRPAERPRTIHVLDRGDVRQPGPVASAGAMACVPGLEHRFELADSEQESARRAALARWLSAPQNVLTWRSIANRVWHYHFGRGLVDTPNDFGRMGASPTHPELLDWLAVELLEHGGSLKHLHRQIVTSATYRQSSALPSGSQPSTLDPRLATDADNRLLWRMNRTRLDAESVRDAVLAVSGTIDRRMGGPSVKQFVESPGIHVTPNVDYRGFDIDDPANHRRSVYRFIFRTLPDPFMESLDCPDASQWTADRSESVTALQALSMLNNQFVVRQSQHLAERLARDRPGLPGHVERLYELVLHRPPSADERQAFVDYATAHGLANACRMLLNSNEFMFVD
ncbi:MAG TPA: DUF1553 domain-containing protein [Planctomycetaceae bacterium]|nr:DUF1553 domain-containing protein [Planctomycetaceae bacterium]